MERFASGPASRQRFGVERGVTGPGCEAEHDG